MYALHFIYFFFFQAEDGIRDSSVTGVQTCSFFKAEDGIRDSSVTGVQTCALPISLALRSSPLGSVFITLATSPLTLRAVAKRLRGPGLPHWRCLAARRTAAGPGRAAAWPRQNGRAAWRERGEVSVVAVFLKKKKTQ